jgi:hypothetical protein
MAGTTHSLRAHADPRATPSCGSTASGSSGTASANHVGDSQSPEVTLKSFTSSGGGGGSSSKRKAGQQRAAGGASAAAWVGGVRGGVDPKRG